jgi:membrane protease YdiL (CAAX protease family)
MATTVDYRGIVSFLLITFALTYGVEIPLVAAGLRFPSGRPQGFGGFPASAIVLLFVVLMWVPALATFLTVRFVTHEGWQITNLRLGSWKPYLVTALLVPVCFAAIYGLTWLVKLGRPDWHLEFLLQIAPPGPQAARMRASPGLFLGGILAASLILGPTINGLAAFGEEFGWRGYLLPKLMPLGKCRAYLLVGLFWGLWHAPLVVAGFNYPGHPILGVLGMTVFTTCSGVFINEFALRRQSTVLAAWIHGALNGQIYGIWRLLFPGVNPLLGGWTGVVGAVVWLIVGLATARVFR